MRPRLHETGTKSNRDHFVSVIVLFIIDVYTRDPDENNSDRSQVIPPAGPSRLTSDRNECKHKYISDRSRL